MELKHDKVTIILYELALLIVPYGIETHSYTISSFTSLLLIVPYGIET